MQEIIFIVEEDPEGGYTARSLQASIFTQAETIDGLKNAIKDAMACHFDAAEKIPNIIHLHYVKEEILTYA